MYPYILYILLLTFLPLPLPLPIPLGFIGSRNESADETRFPFCNRKCSLVSNSLRIYPSFINDHRSHPLMVFLTVTLLSFILIPYRLDSYSWRLILSLSQVLERVLLLITLRTFTREIPVQVILYYRISLDLCPFSLVIRLILIISLHISSYLS